jgi:hypothetical protein
VLLLWLSILVLIPFDLTTVDSGFTAAHGGVGDAANARAPSGSSANAAANANARGASGHGIIATLIGVCQGYLSDSGPPRDAAAVCLSRLLSRPDMQRSHLHKYLQWAADTLAACTARPPAAANAVQDADAMLEASGSDGMGSGGAAGGGGADDGDAAAAGSGGAGTTLAARVFLATGVMSSLVEIAKHGHREALRDCLADTFSRVVAIAQGTDAGSGGAGTRGLGLRASPLLRKLTVKLAARTGLTYMPPRVVAWRYQRGQRSLLDNLSSAGVAAAKARAAAAAAAAASGGAAGGAGSASANRGNTSLAATGYETPSLTCCSRGCGTRTRWCAGRRPRAWAG